MAQTVAAFAAGDLQGLGGFPILGDTVCPHSLGEGRPGGGVLVLAGAPEELIPALGADINTCMYGCRSQCTTQCQIQHRRKCLNMANWAIVTSIQGCVLCRL